MTLLDWSRKARAREEWKNGHSFVVFAIIAAVLLWLTFM
jgi:hypothetical protein